ncbi:MAG: hypothetical protein HRT51_19935 [Colwellia sp.]|nr:hypothetical protein [Colwellia sp.]
MLVILQHLELWPYQLKYLEQQLAGFFSSGSSKTINHLRKQGYQVTVKNRYGVEFNPLLNKAERASYYRNPFDEHQIRA